MEPLFFEHSNRPRRSLARPIGAALMIVATVAFLSPAAQADSTDFDFAQGLMERGYYSLAQIEFQRMVDDPSLGANEKKEGELGLCLLRAKKALSVAAGYREGRDPSGVLSEYGAAEAAFESFLSANPTHPRISDAIFEYCTMLQNKGTFLGQLVDEAKESGSRKVDQYTDDTIRTFDKAITYYDRILRELKDVQEGDALYTRKTQARFYYSLAHYYKGRSLPIEHMSRIPALERAVGTLEDFLWDHEDTVSGYYAFIYKGLAHGELGQHKDAIENLQNVLTSLNPADESDPRLQELVMNLICEAGLHLGRVCNKAKEAGGFNLQQIAADALVAHYEAVPASVHNRYGQLALLEASKALLGILEFNKALRYAQDVSEAASKGGARWSRGNKIRADRLIAEIIAGSPPGAIRPDPELLWRAAEGKFSQGEYPAAIRSYEAVILASENDEAGTTKTIEAWKRIADAYYAADGDRYYEAIAAVEQIISNYPDHELTGDAAYKRYIYAKEQFRVSKDPADEKRFRDAREFFTKNYPSHENAKDLQYFEAYERLEKGNSLARLKRNDEAMAAYREAEAAFKTMDEASVYFELAQARMGQLYFQMAQQDSAYYAKAKEVIEEYMRLTLNPKGPWETTDPGRLARRSQAQAIGIYFLARVHADRKEWGKVLSTLDDYRRRFKNEEALHASVLYQVVRAHVELGDHAAAEAAFGPLWSEMRDSPSALAATFVLARKFDELRKTHEADEKGAEYLKKSADYYYDWMSLRGRESIPSTYLSTVAQMYFEIEQFDRAQELANEALEKLAAEADSEDKTKRIDALRLLFAQISMAGDDARSAVAALEKLAALRPLKADSLQRLAEVLNSYPQEDKKLAEVLGTNPSYLKLLCEAYGRLGLYSRALNIAQFVETRSRDYSENWFWSKYREALMWYERARQDKDANACRNAIIGIENLDKFGLIDSMKDEKMKAAFEELRAKALRLKIELGG